MKLHINKYIYIIYTSSYDSVYTSMCMSKSCLYNIRGLHIFIGRGTICMCGSQLLTVTHE